MFASLLDQVERSAWALDPESMSASEARESMKELGRITRLLGGVVAKVAKRVEETCAHTESGERSAASFVARELGESVGAAQSAIDTAEKLEGLPAVDDAVREGKLSSRQAEMIAKAAS